jgi:hypothetical protein
MNEEEKGKGQRKKQVREAAGLEGVEGAGRKQDEEERGEKLLDASLFRPAKTEQDGAAGRG